MNALCGEVDLYIPTITKENVKNILQLIADASHLLENIPTADNLYNEMTPKSNAGGTNKDVQKRVSLSKKERNRVPSGALAKECRSG